MITMGLQRKRKLAEEISELIKKKKAKMSSANKQPYGHSSREIHHNLSRPRTGDPWLKSRETYPRRPIAKEIHVFET